MNRILIPVVLIVLLFTGAGFYFLNNQQKVEPTPLPQGNVCDKDTMTCSDGTVLYRQGPECDFPPCPSATASGSTESGRSATPEGSGITVTGSLICLPHKNSSGPQTMECAYGLKGSDGKNYALSDPEWKYLMGVGTGETVEIKGKFSKKDDSKYDIVGSIEIETLTKI